MSKQGKIPEAVYKLVAFEAEGVVYRNVDTDSLSKLFERLDRYKERDEVVRIEAHRFDRLENLEGLPQGAVPFSKGPMMLRVDRIGSAWVDSTFPAVGRV